MKLLKSEVVKFARKDTYAIPESKNVLVRMNDKFYIEDVKGQRITKNFSKISDFCKGLASFECGEEVGLVTADGKIILKNKYDKLVLDGEIIRIYSKGKWGFMNRDFKVICSPKYMFIEKFNNGYARFQNDEGKWGVISTSGRVVVKPKYSYIGDLSGEQIAAQTYKGYGAINIHGEVVVPFGYKKIACCDGQTQLFNFTGEKCILN